MMEVSSNLNQIKFIPQFDKYIVYGYLKCAEKNVFSKQHYHCYYNIPSLVHCICLLFYYEKGFNPRLCGSAMKLSKNNTILTLSDEHRENDYNTCYGTHVIPSRITGTYVWRLRNLTTNDNNNIYQCIHIGITDPTNDCRNKLFASNKRLHINRRGNIGYGMYCQGIGFGFNESAKLSPVSDEHGDIITMILDIRKYGITLRYKINKMDQRTMFYSLCQDENINYSIAVSMKGRGCVEFMEFFQIYPDEHKQNNQIHTQLSLCGLPEWFADISCTDDQGLLYMDILLYRLSKALVNKYEFNSCINILKLIVTNICNTNDRQSVYQKRNASKYRKLNMNNRTLKKRLFKHKEIIALLECIGFIEESEYFVLQKQKENICLLKSVYVKLCHYQMLAPELESELINRDIKIYLLDELKRFRRNESKLMMKETALKRSGQSDESLIMRYAQSRQKALYMIYPKKLMGKQMRERKYGIKHDRLQQYIKLENKLDPDNASLKYLVIKIIIYSTIMIISTVVITFIIAFIEDYIEIVTALDNIINCYCIVLQFKDINVNKINSKYISKLIACLQCKCIMCCINHDGAVAEKTMTKIVCLHKKNPTYLDTIHTNSYLPKLSIHNSFGKQNSYSTATKSSNHMEISMTEMSNFHDDRKKYIKTVLQCDQVNNGVTGTFVALPIAETAYIFWQKYINHLNKDEKLEIACAIFFEMISGKNNSAGNIGCTKQVLKKHLITSDIKMEALSVKFLDMMEWLVKHLLTPNIDLFARLQELGKTHMIMNVEIIHFGTFLSAVHLIFEQYFENKYSIKEKYAMDKLFTVASQIMTGQDVHNVNIMSDFTESFDSLDFITSLDVCLKSSVGSNYLHRFLQQTFCDELVIWLQSIKKFKLGMSDKERFMIAKRMKVNLIQPIAPFCINISHETRENILHAIKELETQFSANVTDFKVSEKLFDEGHSEIIRLIEQNHWKRFVDNINTFKNSSMNLH
eukprot:475917_1